MTMMEICDSLTQIPNEDREWTIHHWPGGGGSFKSFVDFFKFLGNIGDGIAAAVHFFVSLLKSRNLIIQFCRKNNKSNFEVKIHCTNFSSK
jgi:hypothetical protein